MDEIRSTKREMEITQGGEIRLRIHMLQLLVSPLPPLPPLLLLLLALVFPRKSLWGKIWRGDVTAQMRHFDFPPPGIGRQTVSRPLLVCPHDIQPSKTPPTGPTGKLLLHPTLVTSMPVQGVLDRITPVATWATILEDWFWNTGSSPLSREHTTGKTLLFTTKSFLDVRYKEMIKSD